MNRIILNVSTFMAISCFIWSIAIICGLTLHTILTSDTKTLQIINDYITHHKKTKMSSSDLLYLVYLIMFVLLLALPIFTVIATI